MDKCVLLTSDPLTLRVLEHLGVDRPLGVVVLAVEFVPKVCQANFLTFQKNSDICWDLLSTDSLARWKSILNL